MSATVLFPLLSRVVMSTVKWSSKTPNERAPFKEGQKGNTEEEEERKEKVPDIGTHNFKNRKNETKVTINNNTINRLPTRMYTHKLSLLSLFYTLA